MLAELARGHRTTLIFVNTRRYAERVARHLSERLGSDRITAHHGSLSKERRLGFNVLIYDGDKQPAASGENINKARLAWAPRSGVQGRPEDWGRIELGD